MKISFKNPKFKMILIICAVVFVIACASLVAYYFLTSADLPIQDAAAYYNEALTNSYEDQYTYTVSSKENITIGEEAYNKTHKKVITVENDQRIQIYHTLQVGNVSINYTEFYQDGIAYLYLNGGQFYRETTLEEFKASYIPLFPIDPNHYNTIAGTTKHGKSTITFSASTPEIWLEGFYDNFDSGSAIVNIDKYGKICESKYTCTYSKGERHISCTISTMPNDPFPIIMDIPSTTDGYTKITNPDHITVLEEATIFLLATQTISSTYDDTILCEVFGDNRKQHIQITAENTTDWHSRIDTNISLSNISTEGSVTTLHKEETFENGELTIVTDNADPVKDNNATVESAKSSCQDILVGTVLLPKHVKDVTFQQVDDQLQYHYTCNEEFAQILSDEACNTLYRDSQVLSSSAQDHMTVLVEGYLIIDRNTGLPIESGFRYKGIYTINKLPYALEFSASQQYTLVG